MKQAPKRIIESLVIVSLIGGLYVTSINDIKAQERWEQSMRLN